MKNFNLIEVKLKEFIELVFHEVEEKRKKEYGEINHITKFLFKPIFNIVNGHLSASFSYQTIKRDIRLYTLQTKESYLKKFKQYNEIIDLMRKETKFTDTFLNFTLTVFIHNAVNAFNYAIDYDLLNKQIAFLKEYLMEKRVTINVKIYYQGIWLALDEFILGDTLKLRRITPDDFIFETLEQLKSELQNIFNLPQCILEFTFSKKYSQSDLEASLFEVDLQEQLNLLDSMMLLNKLGCVFFKKTIITRNFYSLQEPSTLTNSMVPTLNFVNYIDLNDVSKIKKLLELLQKQEIGKYFSIRRRADTPLDIAIKRYYTTFNFSENLQSGITSAIMCLEALFTENKPQLGRSLRERLSILFKIFGFSPLSIELVIKEAYKIRSSYSHGSQSNKNTEFIFKIAHQILEITRLSLLIFLQIDFILSNNSLLSKYYSNKIVKSLEKNSKKKIINILDKAILDRIYYKKLKIFINKTCILFI